MRLAVALALLCLATAARADSEGCLAPDQLRLAEATEAYGKKFHEGNTQQQTIHGVALDDSEKALRYVKKSLGEKPPAKWSTAGGNGCNKALCALEHTLGSKEAALWFLAASAELDAPPSLDQTPYAEESIWEAGELRALARALHEAPPELRKISTLDVFRRMPTGEKLKKSRKDRPTFTYNAVSYKKDPELGGLGTIVIRDAVWKVTPRDVRAIVLHELTHHWDFTRLKEDGEPQPSLRPEWLALSGWESKTGGHGKSDFTLREGVQIATAGEAMPTEDFADSVANYRFAPRLMKAYSKKKFEHLKRFWEGTPRRARIAELESAWEAFGGPLATLRGCAGAIQRATFAPDMHQHELYVVTPTAHGKHWEPVARNQFVVKGKCIERAMAALQGGDRWKALTCRRDPEEIAISVADRLEEVWGAFTEAALAIDNAVPQAVAFKCLDQRDLTLGCLAGKKGRELAGKHAARIAEEFRGAADDALASLLLVQTPLAPTDTELREKLPILTAQGELLYACLSDAIEIKKSDKDGKWTYWVKAPGSGEKRGFKDPLKTPTCPRAFAEQAAASGLKMDADDKLFEHLLFLLRNETAPLVARFADEVLADSAQLRIKCKAKGSCAKWLKERLNGIAPEGLQDKLAARLSGTLKPTK